MGRSTRGAGGRGSGEAARRRVVRATETGSARVVAATARARGECVAGTTVRADFAITKRNFAATRVVLVSLRVVWSPFVPYHVSEWYIPDSDSWRTMSSTKCGEDQPPLSHGQGFPAWTDQPLSKRTYPFRICAARDQPPARPHPFMDPFPRHLVGHGPARLSSGTSENTSESRRSPAGVRVLFRSLPSNW